jgi:hypothetical protein
LQQIKTRYTTREDFLFNFVEKLAPNRAKADRGGFIFCLRMSPKSAKADNSGFYVFNLILLQNEPQIGRWSIKGDFMFIIFEK